jgi:hypothetical protein
MREDFIFSYSLIQDFKSTRFWLLPHKIMLGPRTGDNTNSTDRSLDSNRLGELMVKETNPDEVVSLMVGAELVQHE